MLHFYVSYAFVVLPMEDCATVGLVLALTWNIQSPSYGYIDLMGLYRTIKKDVKSPHFSFKLGRKKKKRLLRYIKYEEYMQASQGKKIHEVHKHLRNTYRWVGHWSDIYMTFFLIIYSKFALEKICGHHIFTF